MPRHPSPPATELAIAMQRQRGRLGLRHVAAELRIDDSTLSRLERGAHRPSYDTAVKLAAWLGWTVEQVMDAAGTPVLPPGAT